MKVETSSYIQEIKPKLKQLLQRLLAQYAYVSILAEDGTAKQYGVNRTGVMIGEQTLLTNRGVVVKVFDGGSYSEYAFNEVTDEQLDMAERILRENLVPLKDKLPEGLDASRYQKLSDEPCVFHESTSYDRHPAQTGDEAIVKELSDIFEKGMAMDSRLLNLNVSYVYQQYTKLFLSEHRDMTQDVM